MSYWTHLLFDPTKSDDMKAWKHFSIPAEASVPYIQDFVLPTTITQLSWGKIQKC